MSIRTRQDLIDADDKGLSPEWLFFWRPVEEDLTKIGPYVLSPGYFADFEISGVVYPTIAHWMVAEKARIMCDDEVYQAVLRDMEAPSLERVKELGRQIKHGDQATWDAHKTDLAVRGNFAKFSQNRTIGRYLLDTDDKVLVKASPSDCVWGIGLHRAMPQAFDPRKWKGENRLGFVLMEVRDYVHVAGWGKCLV